MHTKKREVVRATSRLESKHNKRKESRQAPMNAQLNEKPRKPGAFEGGIWMCKIKTQAYLDSLKLKFGDDWQKYGE